MFEIYALDVQNLLFRLWNQVLRLQILHSPQAAVSPTGKPSLAPFPNVHPWLNPRIRSNVCKPPNLQHCKRQLIQYRRSLTIRPLSRPPLMALAEFSQICHPRYTSREYLLAFLSLQGQISTKVRKNVDFDFFLTRQIFVGTSFVPTSINSTLEIREAFLSGFNPSDALAKAVDGILDLYPDVPSLGSPFNTGNNTFGLNSLFKRGSAISEFSVQFLA